MYLPSLDSSNITVEYWNERISLEEFQWIPWWCWSCHCRCNCIQFQLPTFPNPPPSERSIWCLHTLTAVHTQLPSNSKPWKSGTWLDVILIRLFVILSLSTVLNWGGLMAITSWLLSMFIVWQPGLVIPVQCNVPWDVDWLGRIPVWAFIMYTAQRWIIPGPIQHSVRWLIHLCFSFRFHCRPRAQCEVWRILNVMFISV